MASLKTRETPPERSLVGKIATLAPSGLVDGREEILVACDYEIQLRGSTWTRYVQGCTEDGEYLEVPYDQVEAAQ